jgi:hypothetical protein
MLGSAVLNRVSEILQDASNVTWTAPQMIEWLNDAIRALVLVRPDASSTTASMQLVPGTKQVLSADVDLRLIRVVRNMGANGTTPGRAIRLGDMGVLDSFAPDWHTEASAVVVKEYMFDEARPDEFWVTPPVHGTTQVHVEVVKSVLPSAMTASTETVPVDDIYGPALIEWCCYRAFSRDSEHTPNWQRGARHFAAFFNLLQIKMKSDMAINPKVRAMVEKQA